MPMGKRRKGSATAIKAAIARQVFRLSEFFRADALALFGRKRRFIVGPSWSPEEIDDVQLFMRAGSLIRKAYLVRIKRLARNLMKTDLRPGRALRE